MTSTDRFFLFNLTSDKIKSRSRFLVDLVDKFALLFFKVQIYHSFQCGAVLTFGVSKGACMINIARLEANLMPMYVWRSPVSSLLTVAWYTTSCVRYFPSNGQDIFRDSSRYHKQLASCRYVS